MSSHHWVTIAIVFDVDVVVVVVQVNQHDPDVRGCLRPSLI
jgi:hypothetical protein